MDFKKETSNDLGGSPEVINIHNEVCRNTNFRSTLWTGEHLQVTLMCIPVGGEVGLEFHEDVDQLLQIESGVARVYMGKTKQKVTCYGLADRNSVIIVPAGTWHNIVNAYNAPLKLYSVYAPPEHLFGTLHKTKLDSDLQGD
ncbi:MAG: cupin domain-containing protein [Clostridia bacterium]|nr:cupin domain-containing protein [Clostridia bacterium]